MACANHPDREQKAACYRCGKPLCEACLYYANSDPCCETCVSDLQREFLAEQRTRSRRMALTVLIGAAVSAGGVAAWEWGMNQTRFEMALFTPFVMIGIIFGAALLMRRVLRQGSKALFAVACLFTLGVLLRGEYIIYKSTLYRAAAQGLSAEQLLRFSETHTYWSHLKQLGPFDYLFVLAALFLTWRRLWPLRSAGLDIVRPV